MQSIDDSRAKMSANARCTLVILSAKLTFVLQPTMPRDAGRLDRFSSTVATQQNPNPFRIELNLDRTEPNRT